MLGDTGSVNLPPSIITDLTGTFFDPAVGWAIAIGAIAAYAASLLIGAADASAAGSRPSRWRRRWCGSGSSRRRSSPRSRS